MSHELQTWVQEIYWKMKGILNISININPGQKQATKMIVIIITKITTQNKIHKSMSPQFLVYYCSNGSLVS